MKCGNPNMQGGVRSKQLLQTEMVTAYLLLPPPSLGYHSFMMLQSIVFTYLAYITFGGVQVGCRVQHLYGHVYCNYWQVYGHLTGRPPHFIRGFLPHLMCLCFIYVIIIKCRIFLLYMVPFLFCLVCIMKLFLRSAPGLNICRPHCVCRFSNISTNVKNCFQYTPFIP